MKPQRYVWVALSALFSPLGAELLIDSIRRPGPYTEEAILLGAALLALGLTALFFAFQRRAQTKALAQHMRRGSHSRRLMTAVNERKHERAG